MITSEAQRILDRIATAEAMAPAGTPQHSLMVQSVLMGECVAIKTLLTAVIMTAANPQAATVEDVNACIESLCDQTVSMVEEICREIIAGKDADTLARHVQ